MKNNKIISSYLVKSVLLLAAFVFSSCNFKQDPLANQSDRIKNGTPPDVVKPQAKPLPKEALQIDSPSLVTGREDEVVEFKIDGRVLIENVNFEISIANLADFEGATFDSATGVFKWTPKAGFTEGEVIKTQSLIAILTTQSGATNYPVSIEQKEIPIAITNKIGAPVISTISGLPSYNTGRSYNISVTVNDTDAGSSADLNFIVNDCTSGSFSPASNLITYNKSSFFKSGSNFNGVINLNLGDGRVFPITSRQYCFTISAVSRFGSSSPIKEVRFNIINDIRPSRITQEIFEIQKGQRAEFSFSIFDPTQSAFLNPANSLDLSLNLPGSSVAVQNLAPTSVMNYKMLVDASTITTAQEFRYVLTINSVVQGLPQSSTNHTITIKVLE